MTADPGSSRRWRWTRRLLLVGLVAVLGWVGALALDDGLAVRSSLQEARAQVAQARRQLARGGTQPARQQLRLAERKIRRARARTDRALWSVVGRVPVAGRTVASVRGVVDVADAAVALGRRATEEAGGLLGAGGRAGMRTSGGRVDLARLRAADQVLEGLPVDQLAAARDELAGLSASWVPPPVRSARQDTLELADRAVGLARDAGRLLDVLGPFLGGEGPRRYLLVMQNPAELRGTGGLPGFVAVLSADDGRMTLEPPARATRLNRAPGEEEPTPVSAPDAFVRRYGAVGGNSLFSNVNVDPHLPTTAPVMLELYAARTGQRVDGVIAVDPIALEQMFGLVGALDVPDAVADPAGELPDPIPPAQIAETTMVRVYEVFGGTNPRRATYLEQLSLAAFRQLLSSDWDAVAMGRRMARLAASRHLQLYSTDDAEQQAFQRLEVAGRLGARRQRSDLLAVTVNNAAGNKADVHVGHRLAADVRLGLPDPDTPAASVDEIRRQATVRASVRNPLPSSGRADYIIGSYDGPIQQGGRRTINGLVRSWLTLWSPPGTGLLGARTAGQAVIPAAGRIHGQAAFDYVLETPSESTTWWEAKLAGPVPVSVEDGRLVYRLTCWRQAKAVPDRLDVTVRVPEGWRIADASLSGGGAGDGMGVWSSGESVALTVEGSQLRVRGSRTADVALQVALAPDEHLLERVWEAVTPWSL